MKDDNSNTISFGYGLVLRLFAMFSIPLFLSAAIERFGSSPVVSAVILPIAFVGVIGAISARPRFFRQEAPVIAFAVGLTAYILAPSEISQMKFDELAAQIVPVLLLTLAVETRTFFLNPMGASEDIAKVMIAALLAYAEFESLRVIVIDKPQSGNFDIVAAALTAAAALLILWRPRRPSIRCP